MIRIWPYERPQRLTFISDLHLFSSRCNISEHRELIAREIEAAELCVWGGDLFDFRWSHHDHDSESVAAALEWLEDWYTRFPDTNFIYLHGNHDAHQSFSQALHQWSDQRPRFTCGLDVIRVDDTLLLHGDVIEGDGSADAFADYRGRWKDKPSASKMASGIYDMAVAARVHKAAAMAAHRRRSTCIRLMRWLHSQPDDTIEGLRRVVFGHTHRRIDGYRFGDLEFYNGGATIRHVPFHPVTLDFD